MSVSLPVHAACNVIAGTTPVYRGPGSQGFLPFGPDDASHSYRISVGKYRMRLVEPLDFEGGEAIIYAALQGVGPSLTLGIAWTWEIPSDMRSILAFTFSGNGTIASDLPFAMTVLRMPPSLPNVP